MKKLTYLLAPVLLLVVFIAFLPARAEQSKLNNKLEKIGSPEQLKEFRVMRKIGHTLYGIRLKNLIGKYKRFKIGTSTNIINDNGNKLEKIGSPEQLKEFRVMRKIGHTLYGIRLKNLIGKYKRFKIGTSTNIINDNGNKLEKIGSPEQLKEFRVMRKIGHTLYGIRLKNLIGKYRKIKKGIKTGIIKSRENNKSNHFVTIIGPAISCVGDAIAVKDEALVNRLSSVAEDLSAAIKTRSTCQQNALKSSVGQKEALATCVKSFKSTSDEIRKAAKLTRKTIWQTYRNSLKKCKTSLNSTSSAAESGDIVVGDGSENIIDTVSDMSIK